MKRRQFFRKLSIQLAGVAALSSAGGCAAYRGSASARRYRANRSPAHPVLNGIDVLVKQDFAPLRNLRLGLITNHTGQDRQRRATIDLLKNAPGVNLMALFGPEHGIRGDFDDKVRDSTDQKTGLPVYSLYGERRVPLPEHLRNLDALVFDVQDIGCRFYTYPSTMGLCMEAAAKAGLKFFVLDRVNPINGVALEGPVHQGERSFTAFHTTPLRHGMTVGELARMFNAEQKMGADLNIIHVEGWRRNQWFDELDLPWINPSPNMRSMDAATLYPGIGLHEFAISVGRGTDRPFELMGAPYIDDLRLAAELKQSPVRGVECVPIRFTPTYSVFKDQPCGGVAFTITDRNKLNAVDLGITVAVAIARLYPNQFDFTKFNRLLQHTPTIEAVKAGKLLPAIKSVWAPELIRFKQRRQANLLYS